MMKVGQFLRRFQLCPVNTDRLAVKISTLLEQQNLTKFISMIKDSKLQFSLIVESICLPNPCKNGGTCIASNTEHGYACECTFPYHGHDCSGNSNYVIILLSLCYHNYPQLLLHATTSNLIVLSFYLCKEFQ